MPSQVFNESIDAAHFAKRNYQFLDLITTNPVAQFSGTKNTAKCIDLIVPATA